MSRTKMMALGALMKVSNLFLGVAISFYMMPYLVRHLGDRMYGLWTLVGSFLGYYGLMDLGLSSAVSRFISRAVGRRDEGEIRVIVSTSFYLYLGLSILCAAATVVLTLSMGFLVKDPSDARLFRMLMLITGLSFAADFPVRSFNAVFTANLREDVGTGITIARTLLNTAAMVAVVRLDRGVLGLCLATVGVSTLDNAVRILLSYKVEPATSVSPRYFDRTRLRPLFNYSFITLVGRVGDLMRFRLDQLIITATLGLQAVTHYFVGARLVEYLATFLYQMAGVASPFFSQEEGRNDFASIRSKFMLLTRMSVYAAAFFGGCTLVYGKPFIIKWMGPEYIDGYYVLAAFMSGVMVKLIQLPTEPLLFGISRHYYLTVCNLIEGFANLFLSLWLVKLYGIVGVALGTAIPMIVMGLAVQPWYTCKAIQQDRGAYMRLLLVHGFGSAVLFLAAWLVVYRWISPSYLALVLCVTVHGVLFWLAAVRLGFSAEERSLIGDAVPFLGAVRKRLGLAPA